MPYSRFSFVNPGAAAVDELTRLLAERETLRRQRFADSIASRRIALDEQQERRYADHQKRTFDDLALQREGQRVDREYDDSVAGDIINPETAARWEKHGRGGALMRGGKTGQVGEAKLTPDAVSVELSGPDKLSPEDMADLDKALTGSVADLKSTETQQTIAPGIIVSKGGAKWRAERAAAEERASRERLSAAEKAERERKEIESRERIAAENRQAKVEAASERATAAQEARTQRRVAQLSDQFDRNPITKRMNVVGEGYEFVRSLPDSTPRLTGTDAQALIYAFAKAMDPESVVREGEYATVQGYAQSRLEALGYNVARWFDNTGFLTEEAVRNMKQTIGDKYRATRAVYDNYRKGVVGKINRETGRNDGDDELIRYEGVFADAPAPRNTPAAPVAGAPGAPLAAAPPAAPAAKLPKNVTVTRRKN